MHVTGIIFSAPMVRAILREIEAPGTGKTETRRLAWLSNKRTGADYVEKARPTKWQRTKPGDLLWVRESCADEHPLAIQEGRYSQKGRAGIPGPPPVAYRTIYRADGEPLQIWSTKNQKYPYWTLDGPADEVDARHPTVCSNYARDGKAIYWTPSIRMQRWASRLTLLVTAVKVERLQDISEEDAKAEGFDRPWVLMEDKKEWPAFMSARDCFTHLWSQLHGTESWDANPEVVAITFKPYLCNVDQMKEAA